MLNFFSVGTINFSGPLWSNLSFVNLEVPLGDYTRVYGQTDCSNVFFDNVVLRATIPLPIPEPETCAMLLVGLAC